MDTDFEQKQTKGTKKTGVKERRQEDKNRKMEESFASDGRGAAEPEPNEGKHELTRINTNPEGRELDGRKRYESAQERHKAAQSWKTRPDG